MKTEDITTWEAFHGVAKHGNFSRAARAMRLTVPQISKRVAKLEEQLGVRLFQRSTRLVVLTSEGKAVLPKVEALLEDLRGLESTFEGTRTLQGVLRVSSVPFVARRLLMPTLKEFRQKHPGIRVELDLSERVVNLLEENFDLAIRVDSAPESSEMIYRKLAPNDLVICAAPSYLKGTDKPLKKPSDLRHHPMLMLALHGACAFRDGSHRLRDFAAAKGLECENGAFLTELALDGFGVLVRSAWDVRDQLKKGRLVPVLEKFPLETFGNIYAVIPSRRLLAARVRAFMDCVAKHAAAWNLPSRAQKSPA